jgi:hypothetical protein
MGDREKSHERLIVWVEVNEKREHELLEELGAALEI